jgi:hypothetical protein
MINPKEFTENDSDALAKAYVEFIEKLESIRNLLPNDDSIKAAYINIHVAGLKFCSEMMNFHRRDLLN